jgi:hypothetical protein
MEGGGAPLYEDVYFINDYASLARWTSLKHLNTVNN